MSQKDLFCPRCGQANYHIGVCCNDDCNFPNMESNNAIARRREHEASEARRRAAQQSTSRPAPPKPAATSSQSSPATFLDGLIGLAGFVAGAMLVVRGGGEGIGILVGAIIGACLAYALRDIIKFVIGAAVIGAAVYGCVESQKAHAEPLPLQSTFS